MSTSSKQLTWGILQRWLRVLILPLLFVLAPSAWAASPGEIVTAVRNAVQQGGWQKLPGAARDVGAGANGSVWMIGTGENGPGGFGIFRLDGTNWTQMPGAATRISVDGQGNPWVVNNINEIFRWNGGAWARLPGAGKEIAVNAAGQAWVLGTKGIAGGYEIYRWDGSNWALMPGGLTSLAVDSKGNPWGVNAFNQIFRWSGTGWQAMPGSARDIGIGGNDSVFVVGTDGNVYKWDGSGWQQRMASGFMTIAVDGYGVPYGVSGNGEIYVGTP